MAKINYYYRDGQPDYWGMLKAGQRTVTDYKTVTDYGPVTGQSPVQNKGAAMTEDLEVIGTHQEVAGTHTELTGAGYAGAVGIGYQIGNGIGKSVGAYITAKGQAAQLKAQAGISEDNARLAQFGVEQAFRAGEMQIAQIGEKQAEVKARQRTAIAANGIALGVGNTAEVTASTDIKAEQDKIQAEINALSMAWGYRRQRMMGFAQAKADRIMAKATKDAGRGMMIGGLISTAASAVGGAYGAGFFGGGK